MTLVLGSVVSKEGHAVIVFWDMKGPIIVDFLERGETENSVLYCQFFRQYITVFYEGYLLNVEL